MEKRQCIRNAVRHEEIRLPFYSQQIFSEAQQMFLIPFASVSLLLYGYRLNMNKEFEKEEEKEKNKTGRKKESGGCHGDGRGENPEWSRPLRSVLGRWTMQHLGLLQCGLKQNRYLIQTRWARTKMVDGEHGPNKKKRKKKRNRGGREVLLPKAALRKGSQAKQKKTFYLTERMDRDPVSESHMKMLY